MKLSIFLIGLFVLLFSLWFAFAYHENKKEKNKDSLWMLIVVAILLAIIVMILLVFFLFVVIGSVSTVDLIFSLNIHTEQLFIIGVAFLIYFITIDFVLEVVFEGIFGKNMYQLTALALTRVAAFYYIGIFIHSNRNIIFTVAVGISVIFTLLDALYLLYKREKT